MITELRTFDHRQRCIRGFKVLSLGATVFNSVTIVLVMVTSTRKYNTVSTIIFVAIDACLRVSRIVNKDRS